MGSQRSALAGRKKKDPARPEMQFRQKIFQCEMIGAVRTYLARLNVMEQQQFFASPVPNPPAVIRDGGKAV
jgi:hypothetical protein